MLTAPPPPLPNDRVVFTIHKFLAPIGDERDTFVALPDGGTDAKAVFSYRDRTSTVALAASYTFGPTGALRRYAAWGRTSRFTHVDDRVDEAKDGGFDVSRDGSKTSHVAPGGLAVATSGYSPVLGQELMLRAWDQHGRPAKMALLPEGEVAIESRGKETYDGSKGKVTLEHVAVNGLVWGREDVWLDDKGRLAAVVTRDAEFDHNEAVREDYEALLPELAKSTGADGVAWLATTAKGAGAERSTQAVYALVGGTLIDGTGHPAVKDAVVVIDGDRIKAAGPRAKVTIPPGAATIDVTGKSILPGLWDMHAHVEQVEQGVVYLAAGVTTVRDMGNVLDFITGVRDAIDAGKGLGPRVIVDGLVDGNGDAALGTVRINTVEEIAPTIDRLKKAGCPEVKIYSSIAPALVKPIVQYAHAHGMRAVGHVPIGMTSEQAINAGYDSISHISYLTDAALPESATKKLSRVEGMKRLAAIDLASPEMKRELAAVKSHHVVIDDTLSLEEQIFHTAEENAKREPGIATLPRELEATLGGLPPSVAADGDAAFQKYVELLGELHKRGVVIVAGTDINVPGHSLHRELELYVKAGFSPLEAIQAATIVPARFMHMDKELGTVEAGKRADLVVVDGDPLADVSNVRKTALVVARGRAYDSAALWKMAGFRALHPAQ
jgi:imidazolonepropionase-like amidohydrolase